MKSDHLLEIHEAKVFLLMPVLETELFQGSYKIELMIT